MFPDNKNELETVI